jgi:hypothetical protein
MSKVTLTLRDVRLDNGRNVVALDCQLDASDTSPDAPPSGAMLAAVTIRKLWDSGELARLAPRINCRPRVVG